MKCGVPIIVPDTGSGPELVKHEVTGLIYNFGDPSNLSHMITRLLTDQDLHSRIKNNSLCWSYGKFNPERHTEELYRVIGEAVN